ncbi:glycine zipper family protein [Janthinobacterium agaricidamnosum]|uniref:Proline-rich region n=1 Tax=Janthinobacterium agaricidamnosum NBRC 102515 = DSM 9628 TaxID=1349767 RepID=W0V730_9BURK|nr:glycine zipper family protein [Janthinobacterium agaricidamnosum]CDG84634.1 proline-rich region [Janthinobacterium agaricidamnosum NBRC 102515 = DSM 9628]
MNQMLWLAPLSLLLGACTVMPGGPSALVLPGSGKSFDQFRSDDFSCRSYAQGQVGGTAQQAGIDSGVRSAALGTVIGALAGAAIDGGHGAGVGAGTGLVFGSLAGAGAADSASYDVQQRYDYAYQQCMYGAGHKVPVAGRLVDQVPSNAAYPPPNTPPPPER